MNHNVKGFSKLSKEEKIKFVNCLTKEDEKQRMIEYFKL